MNPIPQLSKKKNLKGESVSMVDKPNYRKICSNCFYNKHSKKRCEKCRKIFSETHNYEFFKVKLL